MPLFFRRLKTTICMHVQMQQTFTTTIATTKIILRTFRQAQNLMPQRCGAEWRTVCVRCVCVCVPSAHRLRLVRVVPVCGSSSCKSSASTAENCANRVIRFRSYKLYLINLHLLHWLVCILQIVKISIIHLRYSYVFIVLLQYICSKIFLVLRWPTL